MQPRYKFHGRLELAGDHFGVSRLKLQFATAVCLQGAIGGVDGNELAKLKKLEDENKRLKQLAGDQALAIQIMREELGKKGWA